eukprot:15458530-Alexandrium_andersonii.AAC.1
MPKAWRPEAPTSAPQCTFWGSLGRSSRGPGLKPVDGSPRAPPQQLPDNAPLRPEGVEWRQAPRATPR